MVVLLDVLNSIIIGGFIILMSFGILDSTNRFLYSHNDDLIVQESLTSINSILEYDMNKMGFAVPEGQDVILLADTTRMRFLADLNRDWHPDTVEYYLGAVSELANTQNPDDRFLYRKVNGQPASGWAIGVVTVFHLEYLNQDRITLDISNPITWKMIKLIRTTLRIENPAVYSEETSPNKNEYRTVFWQETNLASKNLRR
jgi:hypothetical protein